VAAAIAEVTITSRAVVLGFKAKKSTTAHPNQVTRYKKIALFTDDSLEMR
jgi:hypothetical protein